MTRLSWFQKIYWTRFAKPIEERALFAQLIQVPVASILEVGIGNGQRMRRIAQLVELPAGVEKLRYVGTDEFESAKGDRRHLSLKQAHQITGQLGWKASLIPGDISSALPRVAHKMGTSDLVIFDGGLDPHAPHETAAGSWLEHLTHEDSVVLGCQKPGDELQKVQITKRQLSRAA